ncbi:MAG: hypothetical protein KGS72_13065 [Cyanobacteria bacterium REEB67]|nr:hypothetical protein [Cyanobacteria bacterium REEB67]
MTTPTRLIYETANAEGSHTYRVFSSSGSGDEQSALITIGKRKLDKSGHDKPTISHSLNANANKTLLEAIEDFDKAGHILTFECGPITAAPPLTVPPPMRPIELQYSIEPQKSEQQCIIVMEVSSNNHRQYTFDASDEPAVNLRYPKEFFKDMGGCIDLAAPLFDAIRKFYIARRPELDETT